MVSSSPRRPSKFIESLPPTSQPQDSFSSPPTPTNELFFSILSEMDEFESRRQQTMRNRGTSQSSLDSIPSSTSSPRTANSQVVDRSHTTKEGNRRSINFTRSSMDKELEGRRRRSGSGSVTDEEHAGDKLTRKFVGRLRALTGGREKDGGKRYSGS